jgi:glycosyltransferase involved in cell wall biosynthesis
MILKNESKHLAACLDTVSDIVDEIIILDSGSTDSTKEIAENIMRNGMSIWIGRVLVSKDNWLRLMRREIMFSS